MTTAAARSHREGHTIITGGAGFLGTNIAQALAARGEDLLIFDNLSRLHVRENVCWLQQRYGKHVSLRLGDVRDPDAVNEAIHGARAVIHLAAQVAVTTSVDDPITDFEVNARGTLNVLEAVRHHAPEAPVLFASTNKVTASCCRLRRSNATVSATCRAIRSTLMVSMSGLNSPFTALTAARKGQQIST